MKAVWTKIMADLGRRRLQGLVIAVVILLAGGAATMALNLLVESDAPYDHAFVQANGAHITLTFAADRTSEAQLRATTSTPGVTESAGPWPAVSAPFTTAFGDVLGVALVGRSISGGAVDRLTLESGRWVRAANEIVLSRRSADSLGLQVGDQVTAIQATGSPTFHVVGIAVSISPATDAWVMPGQIARLVTAQAPLSYQMLYRVTPAATAADLGAATQAITRHLPAGSVVNASNYLDVKRSADQLTAVMIPFLLAFSAFALLASTLIIGNVISGVVLAAYREIGVMKSVGFTPGQVMLVLLGQILLPVCAGCLAGIPLGTLVSQPFLSDTAHALGLPSAFSNALWVDVLILAGMLALAVLTALGPAWRAGRLSAVTAITLGTAPDARHAGGVGRTLARLPLPRPVSLGLGDAFARPVRSFTTMAAILIGVTTIVFALNLHLSLNQVAAHLDRDPYVQVEIRLPNGGIQRKGALPPGVQPAPAALSDRQITALLTADPGTARFVAETDQLISVPGIAQPISYYAYRGPSSWIGYALIAGRWFSGLGEIVAPTRVFTQGHFKLGDTVTAHMRGQVLRSRLVGEIFDQTEDDLLVRGTWATLGATVPDLKPDQYEVGLKPGTNARTYSQRINVAGSYRLDAGVVGSSSSDTSFVLLNTVIAGLALILTAIAVAGVFNTVLLNARERARDIAILKAIGMSPRQVVGMVVTAMAFLGVIGGAIGVPIGLALHRQILEFMGRIASGTHIPPSFFDLISHPLLPLLALSGALVAALGARLPAQWAASSGVADILQSE